LSVSGGEELGAAFDVLGGAEVGKGKEAIEAGGEFADGVEVFGKGDLTALPMLINLGFGAAHGEFDFGFGAFAMGAIAP